MQYGAQNGMHGGQNSLCQARYQYRHKIDESSPLKKFDKKKKLDKGWVWHSIPVNVQTVGIITTKMNLPATIGSNLCNFDELSALVLLHVQVEPLNTTIGAWEIYCRNTISVLMFNLTLYSSAS